MLNELAVDSIYVQFNIILNVKIHIQEWNNEYIEFHLNYTAVKENLVFNQQYVWITYEDWVFSISLGRLSFTRKKRAILTLETMLLKRVIFLSIPYNSHFIVHCTDWHICTQRKPSKNIYDLIKNVSGWKTLVFMLESYTTKSSHLKCWLAELFPIIDRARIFSRSCECSTKNKFLAVPVLIRIVPLNYSRQPHQERPEFITARWAI